VVLKLAVMCADEVANGLGGAHDAGLVAECLRSLPWISFVVVQGRGRSELSGLLTLRALLATREHRDKDCSEQRGIGIGAGDG